ncbi:hypothetical protein BGW39_002515 [Mortierella sp. 14UC]|nr:hypothetical protein BGW39_002515 [Mortierella sp. 14UC]
MRFSTILAAVSLAAVASAGTISLAEFSSNHSSATTTVCYECAMNTFIKAVPSCQRAMLDDINSEVLLNDKGKACLCPVAALAIKPETLAPCSGPSPNCLGDFLGFTADIFDYIGKNNNCSTFGHAATSLPLPTATSGASGASGSNGPVAGSGANGLVSSNKMVAFGAVVAMATAGLLL